MKVKVATEGFGGHLQDCNPVKRPLVHTHCWKEETSGFSTWSRFLSVLLFLLEGIFLPSQPNPRCRTVFSLGKSAGLGLSASRRRPLGAFSSRPTSPTTSSRTPTRFCRMAGCKDRVPNPPTPDLDFGFGCSWVGASDLHWSARKVSFPWGNTKNCELVETITVWPLLSRELRHEAIGKKGSLCGTASQGKPA